MVKQAIQLMQITLKSVHGPNQY